jgi:hypothetical protein
MNPDEFFAAAYGDRQLITFVEDSDLDRPPQKSLDLKNPLAKVAGKAAEYSLAGCAQNFRTDIRGSMMRGERSRKFCLSSLVTKS